MDADEPARGVEKQIGRLEVERAPGPLVLRRVEHGGGVERHLANEVAGRVQVEVGRPVAQQAVGELRAVLEAAGPDGVLALRGDVADVGELVELALATGATAADARAIRLPRVPHVPGHLGGGALAHGDAAEAVAAKRARLRLAREVALLGGRAVRRHQPAVGALRIHERGLLLVLVHRRALDRDLELGDGQIRQLVDVIGDEARRALAGEPVVLARVARAGIEADRHVDIAAPGHVLEDHRGERGDDARRHGERLRVWRAAAVEERRHLVVVGDRRERVAVREDVPVMS